jgi:hypothetical protein
MIFLCTNNNLYPIHNSRSPFHSKCITACSFCSDSVPSELLYPN